MSSQSSTTGNVLGAIGAVVGAAYAGPIGAAQGYAIGSSIGNAIDPPKGPTVSGPRLSDLTWQQSSYGANIPRVYGTVALSGNVVWLEHNKLKEVVKKKKSGGKGGGGGTTTKTYTYFATFALMLCQGEVAGVRRIWCGDKLIYNAGSDDLETIIASNQAAKGWKLYTGTDDQLPDPRYEADVGVGNAPAFRGYTYIAFYDFALADYSNTLQAAQFKVEIVSALVDSPTEVMLDEIVVVGDGYNTSGVITGSGYTPCYSYDGNGSVFTCDVRGVSFKTGSYVVPAKYSGPTIAFSDTEFFAVWQGPFATNYRFVTNLGYLYLGSVTQSYCRIVYYDGDAFYFESGGTVIRRGVFNDVPLEYIISGTSPEGLTAFCAGDNSLFALSSSGLKLYRFSTEDLSVESVVTLSSSIPVAVSAEDKAYYSSGYFYFKNISGLYRISASSGVVEYMGAVPPTLDNNAYGCIVYDGSLLYETCYGAVTGVNANAVRFRIIRIGHQVVGDTYLSDVIEAECALSSLITSADLDVSLLTQKINGYRVSGGTIRSVIEPLQGAYPFDVVPSGYKIKFVPRGRSSVMTIPWEDLAASDSADIGDSLPYSREMDSQLPQKVTITALSSTREYASATQSYERLNTSAVNIEQRDIPLVLSDDEIAQMSEKLLFLRWLERDDFDMSLPPIYLALEPSDVVTVQAKFGTFELRQTEINYESDGRLTCNAKLNNAAIYTSNAAGAPGPGPSGTVGLPGATLWVPMDIPVVDETLQDEPGLSTAAVGYTSGWPGAVLVRSNDNGQTYSEIQGYAGSGTLGYARGALTANSGALIDQSALVVDLINGELESITQSQMLAGVNFAAYGADQRWEIIRFQNAALQGDGSYLLSGFIRGDKGTEWATGLHVAGDQFVFLDDHDNIFISVPVESLGLERLYRAVTAGEAVDSASDQAFTYRGVNLKPLSPAFAYSSRDSSGNLTAYAIRRSRHTNSWWVTGVSGPVGEATEAYEADVMSGSTVKRTLTSSNGTFTYSAADQTTDFGSAQANIILRIYQLSATVGRGYPLEATL